MATQQRAGIFAWVLGLALVAVGSPARAQGNSASAAAQSLFEEAKRLMAANRHAEACPKLEESQQLDPGSGTLINLADCYEHVGKLASAFRAFKAAEVGARTVGNAPREQAARDRAAALEPRLPRLEVRVPAAPAPGLEIRSDGVLLSQAQWGVPLPVDPGAHRVQASAPGRQSWETQVRAAANAPPVVVSVPELSAAGSEAGEAVGPVAPPSAEQPSQSPGLGTQRTLAIAAGGVGVVGVVIGSIYGLKSASKHDEADPYCDDAWDCTNQDAFDAAEDARAAGNVSTVAFALGGVGLAAGAVLWFTAPSQESHASASLGVGPGTLTLRAKW
jgi:hypothetical protein